MPDNKNDSLASLTERLREARKIADEYPWGQPGGDFLEAADEIERLQAENAALKARRTVDDAMVGRAEEAIVESEMYSPGMSTFALARRALEAALGTKADA